MVISVTIQIWVVLPIGYRKFPSQRYPSEYYPYVGRTRHQNGLSALVSQTSFRGKTIPNWMTLTILFSGFFMSIPTSFMTIAGENQGQMHRVFWPVFDTDRLFVCFLSQERVAGERLSLVAGDCFMWRRHGGYTKSTVNSLKVENRWKAKVITEIGKNSKFHFVKR